MKKVLLECQECDVIFEGNVPDNMKDGNIIIDTCPECEKDNAELEIIIE